MGIRGGTGGANFGGLGFSIVAIYLRKGRSLGDKGLIGLIDFAAVSLRRASEGRVVDESGFRDCYLKATEWLIMAHPEASNHRKLPS